MKKPEKEAVGAVIWFAIGGLIWGFGIYFGESGYISSSLVIKIALLYFLASFYYGTYASIRDECFGQGWAIPKAEKPLLFCFMKWSSIVVDVLLSIAIIYYCIFY